jgi:hypothetical protein
MTVRLLFNVEAGLGHLVWDLTYPDVVAMQEWSMLLLIPIHSVYGTYTDGVKQRMYIATML